MGARPGIDDQTVLIFADNDLTDRVLTLALVPVLVFFLFFLSFLLAVAVL